MVVSPLKTRILMAMNGLTRTTNGKRNPSFDAGTILAGMVSGLASTGLHQAFKQLVGDN